MGEEGNETRELERRKSYMVGKPPLKHNLRNLMSRKIIVRKHNARTIRKREKKMLYDRETTSET